MEFPRGSSAHSKTLNDIAGDISGQLGVVSLRISALRFEDRSWSSRIAEHGKQFGYAEWFLQEAVARTVWEDVRFPPVSPREVDHLDLEVWLLGERTPVQARGAERAAAITIGKRQYDHFVGAARTTQKMARIE